MSGALFNHVRPSSLCLNLSPCLTCMQCALPCTPSPGMYARRASVGSEPSPAPAASAQRRRSSISALSGGSVLSGGSSLSSRTPRPSGAGTPEVESRNSLLVRCSTVAALCRAALRVMVYHVRPVHACHGAAIAALRCVASGCEHSPLQLALASGSGCATC